MFKLLRYFSIASALAIVLITQACVFLYARDQKAKMIASETESNVALARALANTVLLQYGEYLRSIGETDGARLRARPETGWIDATLRHTLDGLKVHKVKIYDPGGLTVYSSEARQIGESKRGVASFEASVREIKALSQLSFRDTFSAYSGLKTNLDLVETYVPITDEAGSVRTVFEVYTDVTARITEMRADMARFVLLLLAAFGVLYVVLFLLVFRADGILARQYAELASFNSTLEARVAERTQAAEAASAQTLETNARLAREIEERKRIETELTDQREALLQQQTMLGKLIRTRCVSDPDWKGSLRILMATAARTLAAARASTWLFNAERDAIECLDLFMAATRDHTEGLVLKASDFPKYFAALETDDFIAAHDAHADPRTSEFSVSYLTPNGISSMLDVPVMRDGAVAGVVCLEHIGAPIAWRPEQQVFATAIASLVSLVLEGRDRMRMERELRQSNIELKAATKAKAEFLATMSHEIRTPMNGVLGMLGLLLGTRLADEQKRMALTARNSAESLLVILNDILDYSKLEARKVHLEVVSFSPEQILDEVISLLRPEAKAKSLELAVGFAPDFPMWLCGDPIRLRQILFNLVTNAIKFTERGHVRVQYAWLRRDEAVGIARFEIADTGIGIPKEDVGRLFARFTQADASTTRRFGGTGLGLAISKQLVELMGGRIGVISEPGQGSTFWFEVPLTIGTPMLELSSASADQLPIAPRQLHVLVADDNRVNQSIVQMLLAKHGHSVDVVANGQEAVEAVRKLDYDLVLMDVQMPEMDGATATRLIRRLEGPRCRIPIIALTANAMPGHREEYLEAGMDGYIAKPLRPLELFTAILRVLPEEMADGPAGGQGKPDPASQPSAASAGGGEAAGGIARAAAAVALPPEAEPLLDRSIIDAWCSGLDAAAIEATLGRVPDECAICLSEIKAAIAAGDLDRAQRGAHRMKGMAGNLGAARLARLAKGIEVGAPAIAEVAARVHGLEAAVAATLSALKRIA